ncbi:hypothetical protein ACIOD0_27385 [Kitasatospora albolonga]
MTHAPEERHPREGRPLDRQAGHERGRPVTYSASTSAVRRAWWKVRSALRLPVKG